MDNYSVLSIQFWGFFLFFFVAIYVSWYLPGMYILGKNEKNRLTHFLLSIGVGIVLWGMQAYILGYLHLRFFTYLYLLFFILHFRGRHLSIIKKIIQDIKSGAKQNVLPTIIICTGIIIQLLPVANSGMLYRDGIHFSGVNAFDGVMHLAFISSITHYFPPVEPGAFDHPMMNYHYWSDMIIADIVRIWHLPIAHVFFQYLPFTVSFLTGIAAYKVVRVFGFSKVGALWAIFFNYFSADASYLLVFIVHRALNFSAPAIDNGVTQFLNMPHALAKLIFLISLIPLHYWLKTNRIYWGSITVVCFSVLIGIKIYFGLFGLFGFLLIILLRSVRYIINYRRKSFIVKLRTTMYKNKTDYLLTFFILLFSISIYFPPNISSGGLIYAPLEWAKIFIGPTILNWGTWWPLHQAYEIHNNIRGIVFLDTLAILITLISVHGTRLIGFIPSQRVFKKLGFEKIIFFIPGLVIFQIIGMYTMQKSGGLNIFNFFVVGAVVLSLLSALVLENISFREKKIMPIILTCLIVITTIPRIFFEINRYGQKYITNSDDTRIVSLGELEGLRYIRSHTPVQAIIQSHPQNSYDNKTPYVAYFSDRLTFLSGIDMQQSHNQPIIEKKKLLEHIFEADHPQRFVTDAKAAGINYLYVRKVDDEKITFPLDPHLLNPIFKNNAVVIYKLQL